MSAARGPAATYRWITPAVIAAATLFLCSMPAAISASTYVVNIPLDSPIYAELETLNGLGYLDTYINEIKPISRIEAASLVAEAEENLNSSDQVNLLAQHMVKTLKQQLSEEFNRFESDEVDNEPTTIHVLDRLETQYVYSSGTRRYWNSGNTGSAQAFQATEGTPLLPNNDGLPTADGSNEIIRMSGWAGCGGFLTGYSEGAVAGPITDSVPRSSRGQLLGTEVVVDVGNVAISFGQKERSYGTGYFSSLFLGNNAAPFPALSIGNVHASRLPWILRYLGPGKRQFFMGQLDANKSFAQHPWIVGHALAFKPLPTLELGLNRAIIFGGRNNDHYGFGGFLGRFTGLATGDPRVGNTHSRAGASMKFYFPSLRNLQVYQAIVGEDNLSYELPPIGRYLPLLSISYQGGVYLPRLTEDGLTDLRFEYAILEPNYSVHDDGLYWVYDGSIMGNPLGPNASQVDIQIGRWFDYRYKLDTHLFYTEQAPTFAANFPYPKSLYPYRLGREHSVGMQLSLLSLPTQIPNRRWTPTSQGLFGVHTSFGVEYVEDLNYQAHSHSVRLMVMLSGSFDKLFPAWNWN